MIHPGVAWLAEIERVRATFGPGPAMDPTGAKGPGVGIRAVDTPHRSSLGQGDEAVPVSADGSDQGRAGIGVEFVGMQAACTCGTS
jgi:hypothetical protein